MAISYTKSGDVHIAYQVAGQGPLDITFFLANYISIETVWDEPELAAFMSRLASFARVILFAASFPERTSGLVLVDTHGRSAWAPYPRAARPSNRTSPTSWPARVWCSTTAVSSI